MERPPLDKIGRSKRVKRSWEYITPRRTFLVRSIGKGPEEGTAAMLEGEANSVSLTPPPCSHSFPFPVSFELLIAQRQ